MGIQVGILVKFTLPTSTLFSLLESFEDPASQTPLSSPCENCTVCRTIVGKRSKKSRIGVRSILIFDLMFETIYDRDSGEIVDCAESRILISVKSSLTLVRT